MSPSAFDQPLELQFTGLKVLVCECRSTTFQIKFDKDDNVHYYCNECGIEHKSTQVN